MTNKLLNLIWSLHLAAKKGRRYFKAGVTAVSRPMRMAAKKLGFFKPIIKRSNRTECPKGHDMSDPMTVYRPPNEPGRRICKLCMALWKQAANDRKRFERDRARVAAKSYERRLRGAKTTKGQPAYARKRREGIKPYAAFQIYFEMGETRSLSAVAKQVGKSLSLIEKWSTLWDWVNRARAWDASLEPSRLAKARDRALRPPDTFD